MPDIQNPADQDFSAFDSMSDEDLEKLLWNDFSKQKGEETDTEQLLYITEVLAQRRKDRNEGKTPAQAWESFKKNYCTDTKDLCNSESDPICTQKRSNPWKWSLIATAAALALVIGMSVTAKAFRFDIWTPIARWTKDSFYFFNPNPTTPQQVNKEELLPTWVPEEYILSYVATSTTASGSEYTVVYLNDDKVIRISATDYSDETPTIYEKGDSLVGVYRSNGIDYYLFSNHGRLSAVWISQNCECCIEGPLSETEIKKMIDSIRKDG